MAREHTRPSFHFLLLALCGALAGSLIGTSWFLFELMPEVFHSLDAFLFALLLIGPPVLPGVLVAAVFKRHAKQYPAFVVLIAALTALPSGALLATWWAQRLADV